MYFHLQSNINGSNISGTTENVRDMGSSSHWGLIIAPGQAQMELIREVFLILYKMVFWVYSLESPRWGNSNDYTQYTILR